MKQVKGSLPMSTFGVRADGGIATTTTTTTTTNTTTTTTTTLIL